MKAFYKITALLASIIISTALLTSCDILEQILEQLLESAETTTQEESETETDETDPTETQNDTQTPEETTDETNPLSDGEIDEIKEYIEFITRYENIQDFDSPDNPDYNWLVSRFNYFVPVDDRLDPADYDFDYSEIATREAVEYYIKQYVHPDITLPDDYPYDLDEDLVAWVPEHGVFGWFGRGFPYNERVVYPVDAWETDGIIHFVSIDLTMFFVMGDTPPDEYELFDEHGDVQVGMYNIEAGTYVFDVDTDTLDQYLYRLIPSEEGSYYLLSKEQVN